MRMRKKKNIDKRIANCSDVLAIEPTQYKGKWNKFFKNDNPIYIEIGCGKGRFILNHAKLNTNINYIAIERENSALIIATEKAKELKLENLIFISFDALKLNDIFEDNEISRVYLNFSDPWPQRKHENRRLTHSIFLQIYDKLLKENGQIHFKTDNMHLFEFSLQEFTKNDLCLMNLTLDLHKTKIFNIQTEYEERFSSMGMPIYRVEAMRNIDRKNMLENNERKLKLLGDDKLEMKKIKDIT